MVDLQDLELKYFCNGYDVPYELRNGSTLNIKPILVKDYPYYEVAKSILEIAKNEMGDIEIIKMSYLEFLFNLLKRYSRQQWQRQNHTAQHVGRHGPPRQGEGALRGRRHSRWRRPQHDKVPP